MSKRERLPTIPFSNAAPRTFRILLNNIDAQYRVNYTSSSFQRGGDGATLLVRATSTPSILRPRHGSDQASRKSRVLHSDGTKFAG